MSAVSMQIKTKYTAPDCILLGHIPIQHVYLFTPTFILKIGPFSLGNYLYVSITNIASTQKVSDSQNYVLNGCQMFVTNGDEW